MVVCIRKRPKMTIQNPQSFFSKVHLATFSLAIFAFSMGATITWSSPVLPKLRSEDDFDPFDRPITSDESSWISSCLTLGAAVGSIIYGYIANILGRRICLLSLGPQFIISYILLSSIGNVEVYYISRLIAGIAVGGFSSMTPIYMSELASKSERGRLSGIIGASACLGFIYSYAVGPFVSITYFNISLIGFPCIYLVLFFINGQETAHYYAIKGKKDLAKKALTVTRSRQENTEIELSEIFKKAEDGSGETILQSFSSKTNMKAFMIAMGLFLFQQASGIICIQFYSQDIFEMTGSNIKAEYCSIIIGSLQFLSGFGVAFITDKFGRKTLLSFSALGMALAEIPLGTYCYFKDNISDSLNFIPLLCMAAFIIAYNLAFGPLPFTVTGEVFPSRCRTVAISSVMCTSWLLSFICTKYFKQFVDWIGIGVCFWIFAGCCLLSIIFVNILVIETKGKTLEEIQDRLSKPISLRKSWCPFA